MANTSGKVVGVNKTRDAIATRQGSIFTEVSATNADGGRSGNTATVSVHADGHGRFTLKVDGRLVHEVTWTPSGRIEQ